MDKEKMKRELNLISDTVILDSCLFKIVSERTEDKAFLKIRYGLELPLVFLANITEFITNTFYEKH